MKALFRPAPDTPPPPPAERSATLLLRLYYLVLVIAGVHVCVFVIFLVVFALGVRTLRYYQDYLEGPMSGPNVAQAVNGAFGIVDNVHNITSTAASATNIVSTSIGLSPAPGSRHLLSASDDAVKLAVAGLINASAQKVLEFNASAPSDFLHMIVQTDWRNLLEPKVADMLAIARYGTASIGTVLGALGSPVDPAIVKPVQPRRNALSWRRAT